jgi:hypothetical protein
MAKKTQNGLSTTNEYFAWSSMIQRCYKENAESFPLYGGRGITVCDRWKESFLLFFEDMGTKPSPTHSLDRWPNKNGNYEPTNCRWATRREQSYNRRSNVLFEINGIEKSLEDWCLEYGVPIDPIRGRVSKRIGMPILEALTKPIKTNGPIKKHVAMNQRAAMAKALLNGETLNIKTCFADFGVTNAGREMGRAIERKFNVVLDRKRQVGFSRYGVPCNWVDYKLNHTEENHRGIEEMIKYVEENKIER